MPLPEEVVRHVVVGLEGRHRVDELEVVKELERAAHRVRIERGCDAIRGEDGPTEPAKERDEPERVRLVEGNADLVAGGQRLGGRNPGVTVRGRSWAGQLLVPIEHQLVAKADRDAPRRIIQPEHAQRVRHIGRRIDEVIDGLDQISRAQRAPLCRLRPQEVGWIAGHARGLEVLAKRIDVLADDLECDVRVRCRVGVRQASYVLQAPVRLPFHGPQHDDEVAVRQGICGG